MTPELWVTLAVGLRAPAATVIVAWINRMSKHDLQARPIYAHKRDSIEAHLTIVFAAPAVASGVRELLGCTTP
jgi:hypothetical protein